MSKAKKASRQPRALGMGQQAVLLEAEDPGGSPEAEVGPGQSSSARKVLCKTELAFQKCLSAYMPTCWHTHVHNVHSHACRLARVLTDQGPEQCRVGRVSF